MMTQDLYTQADIAKVRDTLLKEQKGKCAALNIDIKKLGRTAVLDHVHSDEQLVRAVLERECNAFLGVVENAHKRFFRYWLPTPLPDVLRALASYLERPKDTRWRHNGWLKKLQTKFNALTTKQRSTVLELLGCTVSCSNDTARKKEFAKLLKDRKLGYNRILAAIESAKS
jgi:hypothetical protein